MTVVNCPLCGDVTRLVARVAYVKDGDPRIDTVLWCNVEVDQRVLYYFCTRHRLHLEPIHGPEPVPGDERQPDVPPGMAI
jgi:hypothetical protein